jgi:hypothetical protein
MKTLKNLIGCLMLMVVVPAQAQNTGWFGPLITAPEWPSDCLAIHAVHLPGGNVLLWGYGTQEGTQLFVRNSFTGQFLQEPDVGQWYVTGANLFCSGHTLLPDGKALIVGGKLDDVWGIQNTFLFDPVSMRWSSAGLMEQPRYYPTPVLLADGNVAVVSGWTRPHDPNIWADKVEIRNTATGAWTAFRPEPFVQPHYYPFLFTVYRGAEPNTPHVFMAGPSLREPADMSTHLLKVTSPTSGEWSPFGGSSDPVQGNGAVMLIRWTEPSQQKPYRDLGVVYKFGGSRGPASVTNRVKYIDLNAQNPGWQDAAPMAHERGDCSTVVLPDGTIAIVGGSSAQRTGPGWQHEDSAVKNIELYNCSTGTFCISPQMARTRMYHSVALLQPDASVLTAGGQYWTDDPNQPLSEFNGQVYYPPYLQTVGRPTITGTYPLTMSYGEAEEFVIYTNEANDIENVALIRLAAVTHSNDMNARYINLSILEKTSGSVTVRPPFHAAIAPPGDYMLFILNDAGVPSVARYVRLQ